MRTARKNNKYIMAFLCLQFIILGCPPANAKEKKEILTYAVQRVVYDAGLEIEQKQYQKAEKRLLEYISKNSKNPHYLVEFILGNALTLSGRDKKALVHYAASVDLKPGYAPAWQNMAKIYFDMEQHEKAGDCLLKAYEFMEKKDSSMLYNAAAFFIMADKEAKALPYLEALVSQDGEKIKIIWVEALLKVCMDLQLEKKAIKIINELICKNKNDPELWKMLGRLYLWQKKYKKALAVLIIQSYLKPLNKKEDFLLLGDLSNFAGTPLKAAGYYHQAIEMDSQADSRVYEKLASAYILAHRDARALEVLNKTLAEKPCAKLWFMRGRILYRKEKFNEAYQAFNNCAGLDSKNGRAYLMMGYCSLNIKDKKRARPAFQKAAGFPKQRKNAKEMLRYLKRRPLPAKSKAAFR